MAQHADNQKSPLRKPFTASQSRAITSTTAHTVVLAGPGSGKTTVALERVIFLLKNGLARRVGIVTYTSDSAKDIRQRLLAAGIADVQVIARTFHSYAISQLQSAGEAINVCGDVIHEPVQHAYLKKAITESKWEGDPKEAMELLHIAGSHFHLELKDPERRLIEAYRASLKEHGKYDFAEMLRRVVQGMQDKFVPCLDVDHLIIDEAQDIDDLQFAWIRCHVDKGIHTTMVGDDDQCIYRFRHALGLQGLKDHSTYVGLTDKDWLYLEENFRSHSEIVTVGQVLMKHDTHRFAKDIKAPKGKGGRVSCASFKNTEEELMRVALSAKPEPIKWAVLAMRNVELDRAELALEQRGIPYWRREGESIWETGTGILMLDFLSSLAPKMSAAEKLTEGLMLLDVFMPTDSNDEPLRNRSVDDVLRYVADSCKEENKEDSSESDSKKDALRSLESSWKRWHHQIKHEAEGKTDITKKVIQEVGAWVSLCIPDSQKPLLNAITRCLLKRRGYLQNRIMAPTFKMKEEAEGVHLSTLHASKGLEFENVWIFGLDAKREAGLPPGLIEDKRRVVYVGFTRAKTCLVASYVEANEPSRFLAEAGLQAENKTSKRNRRKIYGA